MSIIKGFIPETLDRHEKTSTTFRSYRKGLRLFDTYLDETKFEVHPGIKQYVEFRKWLSEKYKDNPVNLYLTPVREVLKVNFGVTERMVGIKNPRSTPRSLFSREDIRLILSVIPTETIRGKRNRMFIRSGFNLGLRSFEVVILEGRHYKIIKGKPVVALPERPMFLTDSVNNDLKDYLDASPCKPSEPLFRSYSRNNKGEPLTTSGIRLMFGSCLKLAGLEGRGSFDSLRQSAISIMVNEGVRFEKIFSFSRLKSADRLWRYYQKMNPLDDSDPAERYLDE